MAEDIQTDIEVKIDKANESWGRLEQTLSKDADVVVNSVAYRYKDFIDSYGWGDMDDVKQTARLALFLAWNSKESGAQSWRDYRNNVQVYYGHSDSRMKDIDTDVFVGFAKKTMDRGVRKFIRDNMGHSEDTKKREGWAKTGNFTDWEQAIGGEGENDYLEDWLSIRNQDDQEDQYADPDSLTVDRLGRMFNLDTSGLGKEDNEELRQMLFSSALEILGQRGLPTGEFSGTDRERSLNAITAKREAAVFKAIFVDQLPLAGVQRELSEDDPEAFGNYDTLKRAGQRIPGILSDNKDKIATVFKGKVEEYKQRKRI